LDAYVWEPERNFATTFFTKYNPGYQSALIGAVAKMVTGYLNEPKGNLESLVAGCKTDLEYVISGGK
ncbi:MAG: hypothetical protein FWE62_05720, partial [Firmicutes bacterium]|nr:hypothetical protein [Bacillota bacterium]